MSSQNLAYWQWKHVYNPFGPSTVWVAEEDGELIGLRTFMAWTWQSADDQVSAWRAVDTSTHPAHQGKGIFKKLTLRVVDELAAQKAAFIFNTPNTQSMPGYLKMGWTTVGKLPIRIKPNRPFKLLANKLLGKVTEVDSLLKDALFAGYSLKVLDKVKPMPQPLEKNIYTTSVDQAYLQWRYRDCPIIDYYALSVKDTHGEALLLFYPKVQSYGIELRFCDYVMLTENEPSAYTITKEIRRLTRLVDPVYSSISGLDTPPQLRKALDQLWFLPAYPVGPVLIYRSLSLPMLQMGQWRAGTGAFELFLACHQKVSFVFL